MVVAWQGGAGLAAAPAPVAVGRFATAAAFLDSIGIAAHWDRRDSIYGAQARALEDAILRLGIRHVRGFDPAISAELAASGVSATVLAGPEAGDPQSLAAMVRRANAHGTVIDAVEGPNEPDLFWPQHHTRYRGLGFPAGVIAYQQDLARAFRDGAAPPGITLIGPAAGITYDPGGGSPNPFPGSCLSQAVDLGNFHPYPFGGNPFSPNRTYEGITRYIANADFPSVNLDEFPYAWRVYAPPFAPKPMAATETGYPTWRRGVSEAVQAIYLPRLVAEYFRLGVRRTYLYELADILPDPAGLTMDDHFGILRNDLAPKPAFTALASLFELLRQGATSSPPGVAPSVALTATLPPGYDQVRQVHTLLLRVSGSTSLLLAWHEVSSDDLSRAAPREITVPDGRLGVTVAPPDHAEGWFAYTPDWHLAFHAAPHGTGPLTVPLQNRVVAVLLRRPAIGSP
jgi:hypothetical protein